MRFFPLVLLLTFVEELPAQRPFLEGGVATGNVPRALHPLCASARRLRGVGLSARGGLDGGGFRVGATVDFVGRFGVGEAAGCVPRSGISVDSSFAPAGNSATSLGVSGSVPIFEVLELGAETGWVLGHSSWFIGPTIGARFWRIRTEVAARRHVTRYDEVTRDFGMGSVRELSRASRSERSWGAVARVLVAAF